MKYYYNNNKKGYNQKLSNCSGVNMKTNVMKPFIFRPGALSTIYSMMHSVCPWRVIFRVKLR